MVIAMKRSLLLGVMCIALSFAGVLSLQPVCSFDGDVELGV